MSTEVENDNCVYPFPPAREKRERNLAEQHARERLGHEQLEKVADFFMDAMARFWPETSGKPVVILTLSTPEVPSQIRLRIDASGTVIDATDESPF
jgi:hypothetical protein